VKRAVDNEWGAVGDAESARKVRVVGAWGLNPFAASVADDYAEAVVGRAGIQVAADQLEGV
jgi:hypothetical protein